jgi:hypothetical protein
MSLHAHTALALPKAVETLIIVLAVATACGRRCPGLGAFRARASHLGLGDSVRRLVHRAVRQRIDAAIVRLEDIQRHIDCGLTPVEAILKTQRQATARSKLRSFGGDV